MAERRQVMTFFLFSVGTKAALVCLSLYILNLCFSVTYQLKSLSRVLNNVMVVLSSLDKLMSIGHLKLI